MTIDHQELTLLEAKKTEGGEMFSNAYLKKHLASRNLPYRGSSQCLFEPDNGNFLKE